MHFGRTARYTDRLRSYERALGLLLWLGLGAMVTWLSR
jgi:hypothetical protein